MSKFGVYVFRLRKDNPASGITSNDVMVGEVDMSSKAYAGLDVEEACRKRVESELQAKNGLSFYSLDDIIDEQFLEIDSDKNHVDSRLRDYICKHTSARPVKFHYNGGLKNTELLRDTTVEEVVSEAEIFAGKKARARHSYTLRPYQQDIVDKALEILKHSNEVLINLSTRGGKSFLSLELAKKTGTKNILIITPFPSAESSFRDEIERHTDFDGWTFYSKDDVKVDTKYSEDCNCVFLSFQIFDDKVEKEKLTSLLSQVHFGTVIVDETHNTSSSDRSTSILANIPHEKEIHLSGTPYNDLMSGRFTKDNTVTMDFIDLMKWDKENNHLVGLPKLSVNLVSNMAELNEKLVEFAPDAFEKNEDFSFEKAFGDPSDHTHKKAVAFMKWLFSQSIFTEHKHYLMFVPSVQIARMLPGVLRSIQNEFAVMDLYKEKSADYDVMSSGYEKAINDFEALHDKTIIVTCAKCTTGVTLKRCDAIVMCKRLASAETFVQILFRCMTSYRGKETAALYELDSEACFKVIREVAKVHTELYTPKKSELETYRELLDCVAIESWTGEKMEFTSELAEKFLEKVKSIPTYWSMEEYVDFSKVKLSKDDWTVLENANLEMSDKAKAQFIAGQNEKATGVKTKSYTPRKLEETQEVADGNGNIEKVDVSSKAKEKLRSLIANLDWQIILNGINSFEELMSFTPNWKTDATEANALTKIFRKTLKANERSLRDFIEEYWISLANAKDDPDLEMSLINKLSSLSKVDKHTPEVLVNKMLDKLNAKEYDGSYILDPCVGTGSMLYYAHKRGWPKDHLMGTDIDERFVNLLNKLGYKNVFVKNCLDDDYGDFIRSIIKENELKIIMNPPFNGKLHLQIIDRINTIFNNCKLVDLSPANDLFSGKRLLSDNVTKKFKTVKDHIHEVSFVNAKDASSLFNAAIQSKLMIILYDNAKNGRDIDDFNYVSKNIRSIFDKTTRALYDKKYMSIYDKVLEYGENIKSKYPLPIPEVHGHFGSEDFYETTSKDYRNACKAKQRFNWHLEFSSENERINCWESFHLPAYQWIHSLTKVDNFNSLSLIPYLGDYSHKWTNDDIYNFFKLTDDEKDIVESELKKNASFNSYAKELGLDDDYEDSIENVVEENKLKIIMNPPYDRNLHLKILNKIENCFFNSDIVSLQPIDWLMAPYESSTKSQFKNLYFSVSYVGKLQNLFESTDKATYHLGIYEKHLDTLSTYNDFTYNFVTLKNDDIFLPSVFIRSFSEKMKSCNDNLSNHIKSGEINASSKYTIVLPKLLGNAGQERVTNLFIRGSRWDKIFYHGECNGKTPSETKKKLSNVQNYTNFDYIEFDTKEEAKNWIAFSNTKTIRMAQGIQCVDSHRHTVFTPFMPTYTHPWTDEDLYKYFNLTQDEINMIETEMSDKGAE